MEKCGGPAAGNEQSFLKRWFNSICGVKVSKEVIVDSEERRKRNLYEHPKWRKVADINAVIALIVAAFLCGAYR